MKLIPIDPNNLPECEVLAYSKNQTKHIGKLSLDDDGSILCDGKLEYLTNVTHYLPLDQIKPESDKVLLPKSLTAENGAKALLSGEFIQTIEVNNPDYCGCGDLYCGTCETSPNEPETLIEEVYISWDNIKAIYSKIVSHFA